MREGATRSPGPVREAGERDLEPLVRLLAELFTLEADFTPDARRQREGLRMMLAEPERRAVLVLERGGRILGMVTVQLVVSTAEGALSAWVEDMIVEAGVRGRGFGRRLLLAAERWALARGATRLQLVADVANRGALAFYRRMGWEGTQLVCLRRGGAGDRTRRAARPGGGRARPSA